MIHTLEPILREHPFFRGMEDRHIQLIAGCSMNVRFEVGQVIFHEGDPADHFYLVREGLVSVQFVIPHRGLTTVMTVGNGEVLGWSWLFSPHRWRLDARALKPTRVLGIGAAHLRSILEEHPADGYRFLLRLLPVIAQRLENTRLQLLDLHGG